MSKTSNALLFKFLMTLVVSIIAFNLFAKNAFKWVALLAVLGTVIDYLAGDLLILPKVGSFIGAIINGFLAAIIAIALAMVVPEFTAATFPVLVFGILTAAGEYFFHQYLLKAEKVEP